MTKPAIANPLGFLNTPTAENTNPSNHIAIFTPGAQEVTRHRIDKIKPVKPMPFFYFFGSRGAIV